MYHILTVRVVVIGHENYNEFGKVIWVSPPSPLSIRNTRYLWSGIRNTS